MDKPKRPGRPKAAKPREIPLSTRVTAAHYRALQAMIAETRRNGSVELLLALEAWLEKHGYWPPAGKNKG